MPYEDTILYQTARNRAIHHAEFSAFLRQHIKFRMLFSSLYEDDYADKFAASLNVCPEHLGAVLTNLERPNERLLRALGFREITGGYELILR